MMNTMNTTLAIRPAWTPLTILITFVGFMVWWPLGVGMLAYIIWGDRLTEEFRGLRLRERMGRPANFGFEGNSGNAAFDEYRQETLRRLEDERRKIDEEQREFASFMRNLRQARDKEEFDRFMAERRASPRS